MSSISSADNCIFCKIARNETNSYKVYENEKVLAFLDIAPVNKGHTLVIPKEHFETILDIPNDILKEVVLVVKIVAIALKKALNADGISISINSYEAAGQKVKHAHFHIIPRYYGDGLRLWPQGTYEEGEMKIFKERICKELKK